LAFKALWISVTTARALTSALGHFGSPSEVRVAFLRPQSWNSGGEDEEEGEEEESDEEESDEAGL
jgi:hypothetical protein